MIIGIAGRKQSGKSTIASHLARRHGFKVDAFAASLKAAVQIVYGWGPEHTDGVLKEIEDPWWKTTPRRAMQEIGEAGVQIDPDLWIKSLFRRLGVTIEDPMTEDVVIADLRRIREADAVRAMGGVVWRVDRPALDKTKDIHITETQLDEYVYDEYLVNAGSLPDLLVQVDGLLEHHRTAKG